MNFPFLRKMLDCTPIHTHFFLLEYKVTAAATTRVLPIAMYKIVDAIDPNVLPTENVTVSSTEPVEPVATTGQQQLIMVC